MNNSRKGAVNAILILVVVVLIIIIGYAVSRSTQEVATNRMYLPPSTFTDLPQDIVADLEARKCMIPQTFSASSNENVIKGEFIKKGQTDWAVLCSKEETSSILIFQNGLANNMSEIAVASDETYLQTIEESKLGYSRKIETVDSDYIKSHHEAYGGNIPTVVDHEGINDEFVEKGSTVHYYLDGKWIELQGAD